MAARGLVQLLTLFDQLRLLVQQFLALHVVLVVSISKVSLGLRLTVDPQISDLRYRIGVFVSRGALSLRKFG